MDDLDYPQGRWDRIPFLLSPQPGPSIPWLHHELLQVSCFHKLPQMVFQHSTLLNRMPLVPVVSTIQVLISSRRIPSHLVRPPKERFVLNSIYDLVHWLLERYIYLPQLHLRLLYPQVPSGSRRENFRPRSIHQRHFSLTLQPIIFEPFIFFNTPHELPYILRRPFCQ